MAMRRFSLTCCGAALALMRTLTGAPAASAEEMPNGFVYLRDVDPTIQQDMRYAGTDNFTGKPVPGYEAPECVLVKGAAEALKQVQAELAEKNLSLKVYDCYRPARAVKAFVDWANVPDDPKEKSIHYPTLKKEALFPDYIARMSGHSHGATMDLTIVRKDAAAMPSAEDSNNPQSCTAAEGMRAPDTSIDMGTGFDCFDVKAHTKAAGLTQEQEHNRQMLVDIMERHGFKNYPNEWWHYTLDPEPYPDTIFDFPITPRANATPSVEPAPATNTPK
jgi:zinc D-Ala-D-Ala dipeptidase